MLMIINFDILKSFEQLRFKNAWLLLIDLQACINKSVLITINYYLVLTIHCKILNTGTDLYK